MDPSVIGAFGSILQVLVVVLLFGVERYYDHINYSNNLQTELFQKTSKIVSSCQKQNNKICDDYLELNLIELRSIYQSHPIKDKEAIKIIGKINTNIETIITYDICECNALVDNLLALNEIMN